MTRNLNLTTTKDVNRGTPAFRAPEVLLPGHEQPMGLRQLKSDMGTWTSVFLRCQSRPLNTIQLRIQDG